MAEKNLALLIDAENISADYMSIIRDEANKHGNLSYKRIYGDWGSSNLTKWRSKCIDYNLEPVQQISYVNGKSTSDFTLVIDAMDILYNDRVEGFVVVSSDSDFTRLVSRLRQNNKFVIGMGETKTPLSLVNSVDLFIYIDKIKNIRDKTEKAQKKPTTTKNDSNDAIISLEDLVEVLANIINESADETGWAYWSNSNNTLVRKYPGFDPRNYGFKGRALQFFLANGFEMRKDGLDVFIRVKQG